MLTHLIVCVIAVAASAMCSETVVAEIITPPESTTVLEGKTAEFICIGIGELQFLVDGVLPNYPTIVNKGFTQSQIHDYVNGTKLRYLHAIAGANNDMSNITCRAINGASLTISDPVTLFVQGPSPKVHNFSYAFIDYVTVNISWSPLPGNIIGYNVTAFTDEPDSTVYAVFTEDPSYQLSLTDITDSPCYGIYVNVSGYNGIEGESTTFNGDLLFLRKGPIPNFLPLSIIVEWWEFQLLTLTIGMNVTSLCPCQYPTQINLTILYSGKNSVVTTIDDIPLVPSTNSIDEVIASNLTVPISANYQYTATVTYKLMDRLINSSKIFRLSGIENVSSVDTIGPSIEFVCHFYPDSDATGCYIELLLTNSSDTDVQYTGTANRTGNNDEVFVTVHGVNTEGLYTVYVFEIKEDGSTFLVLSQEVSISLPPNSTSITPSTTSPSSSSSFTTPSSSPTMGHSPSITPTEGNTKSTSHLTGSIAGGLIFVLVVVVAFICGLVWYFYKRRQYNNSPSEQNRDDRQTQESNGSVDSHKSGEQVNIANVDSKVKATNVKIEQITAAAKEKASGNSKAVYRTSNTDTKQQLIEKNILSDINAQEFMRHGVSSINRDHGALVNSDPMSAQDTTTSTANEEKPLLLHVIHPRFLKDSVQRPKVKSEEDVYRALEDVGYTVNIPHPPQKEDSVIHWEIQPRSLPPQMPPKPMIYADLSSVRDEPVPIAYQSEDSHVVYSDVLPSIQPPVSSSSPPQIPPKKEQPIELSQL